MTSRLLCAAACGLAALACANSTPARAKAVASEPPVIVRVSPTSGPAGTAYPVLVTIEGRHFADSANIIRFGPIAVRDVASTQGGTRIVFYAPKESPSTGEVPPAPLLPGKYPIVVSTVAGASNAVDFELTREPGTQR